MIWKSYSKKVLFILISKQGSFPFFTWNNCWIQII